jgi:hypothetical protein
MFAKGFVSMAKSRTRNNGEISSETQAAPQPETQAAPQTVGDTTAAVPDRDRIAMRAYELYRERGGSDGQALEDWLAAERETLAPDDTGRGE